MNIISHIMIASGLAAGFVAELRFLTVVYRRSPVWFFGALFVPLVSETFLLTHWRAAWKPYFIALAGVVIFGLGAVIRN